MNARDRQVLSTIDLVRRHGVVGTGVAVVLEHGQVARRSMYLKFPGVKSELVQEATHVAAGFIDHKDRDSPEDAQTAGGLGRLRRRVEGGRHRQ